jgi:hypothetical protein
MKRKILSIAIAIAFGLSAFVANAQSRYATILISPTNPSNTIGIGANEVANFKTIFENSRQGYLTVDVTLGSYTVSRLVSALPDKFFPIKGPATITLKYPANSSGFWTSEWISWMTLEISPESFPPDKTVIIPEGTGARLALESSTNLLSWSEVWSEVYTNAPSNQFFRLSVQRLP